MAEKKTTEKTGRAAPAAGGTRQAGRSKGQGAQPAGVTAVPKAGKPKAAASGKTVKVRLVRSGIGTPQDQRATLRGLGLTRLRQERELKDSPALRGMLVKVRHLVSVDGQPAA
jgi:large subunit ribosomal protein L30